MSYCQLIWGKKLFFCSVNITILLLCALKTDSHTWVKSEKVCRCTDQEFEHLLETLTANVSLKFIRSFTGKFKNCNYCSFHF